MQTMINGTRKKRTAPSIAFGSIKSPAIAMVNAGKAIAYVNLSTFTQQVDKCRRGKNQLNLKNLKSKDKRRELTSIQYPLS